jgi:Family of unknown function (DUF6225)
MPLYDEIRYQHTPPPLTVGQLRDLLGRFPADMAVRVEIPDEPGSRFAYDQFTVSGGEQPSVFADGVESKSNLCVLLADFPAGEHFLPEGRRL